MVRHRMSARHPMSGKPMFEMRLWTKGDGTAKRYRMFSKHPMS